MLDNPLNYVEESQRKFYRGRAIRFALLCIAIGIAAFLIDILFSSASIDLGGGLKDIGANGSTRSRYLFNGLSLFWIALETVVPLYGLYSLLTLRKHMNILARKELAAQNPEFRRVMDKRSAAKNNAAQGHLQAVSTGLTKSFFFIIAIFLIFIIAFSIVVR